VKQLNASLTNDYITTVVSVVTHVSTAGRLVVSTQTSVLSVVETSASEPTGLHDANTKTNTAMIAKNTFFIVLVFLFLNIAFGVYKYYFNANLLINIDLVKKIANIILINP